MDKMMLGLAGFFLIVNAGAAELPGEGADLQEMGPAFESILVNADRVTLVTRDGQRSLHHQNAEVVIEYANRSTISVSADEVVTLYAIDSPDDVESFHAFGAVEIRAGEQRFQVDEAQVDVKTGKITGTGRRMTMTGPR